MKNWKPAACVAGILVFIGLIMDGISGIGNFDKWINFHDPYSVFFVLLGALALAFAKRPDTMNDFLKFFSKASLVCGALGSLIGWINLFSSNRDWMRLHNPTINEIMESFSGDLSVMALTMFYGLLFSAISNALSKD